MLNVLLFLGSYIFGIFATFRWAPAFAFALYQAVYFYNPQIRWWGYMVPDLPYSFGTVVLMALAMLLAFKQTNQNKLTKAPQLMWMYVMLILMVVGHFYAVLPFAHDFALDNYVKLVIIISIAYKLICNDRDLNIILYGTIFGSWYISFMAFQIGRNSGDRVEGIGAVDSPDANGTAASIAPSIVLVLYYFWVTKNKLAKLALAIAGAFIANAIVLINSRGAFLGVAMSLAYFMFHLFFSKFQRKNQKASVIALCFLGLVAATQVVDASFVARMKSIVTDQQEVNERETGATRTIFWAAAWEMAKDHPMGAGVAGFEYYSPQYIPENIDTGARRNRAVHSTWFEALSELGYMGFIAIIMMVLSCFYTTRKARLALKKVGEIDNYFKVRAIEAAFIAYLVTMTFLNRMRADVLYWCILYTACAYNIYVVKAAYAQADPQTDKR